MSIMNGDIIGALIDAVVVVVVDAIVVVVEAMVVVVEANVVIHSLALTFELVSK